MAILSNQKKNYGTRYNHRDDMLMIMGWLEDLRDETSDDPGSKRIAINGLIDLVQLNRVRGTVGMEPLTIEGQEAKA